MFLALLLVTSIAFGHSIETQSIPRGLFTTVVAYDLNHATNNLNYVYSSRNDNTLYIIAITDGVANKVICRETVTTPIIVAPRGCDNRDESTSVLRTNCGHKTVDGLILNWHQEKTSDACLRVGSDSTCLGPIHLYSTQKPFDIINDDNWAIIPGAYLISGTGPSCAIPTITRVDIQLPKLQVTSTCLNFPTGTYDVDIQASQHGLFNFRMDTTAVEIKPNVALRVKYLGNTILVENRASLNITYYSPNGTCSYTLSLTDAPVPFQIKVPELPVPSNYFKNKADIFNREMSCNWGVSKKRFENNRPLWNGIPEGIPYGGKPHIRTPNGVPVEIKADPRFTDFDHDCARFYPADLTFNGFGFTGFDGPVYNRFEPVRYTCFAPFPFPERVVEIGTLEERAKQCHMLGGMLATATSDVCSMDSWLTYCRRGWIYFDNRCWYMPDPSKDALFQVPAGADSEIVCSNFHPSAISSYPITLWVSAWLQRFFVFWNHPGTRIRVTIEGNRCECYSTVVISSCDCDDPIFPLCSYNIKSDFITWTYTDYHPETLELFRLGQAGLPHDGTEFTCDCEPGWTGSTCTKQTCVPPVLAAASLNESLANPQLVFFKRCYANHRGFCVDDFVYQCQCAEGYGPAADMQNGLYIGTPCTCPAFSSQSLTEKLISIDNVITPNLLGVCGFLERGRCVTEGWNEASCHCRYRWAREGDRELAFTGKTCGCKVTHYTEGMSSVTEAICNFHGTCCPHGEREDGMEGYCPEQQDGCYCDDGWAGESCTSKVPASSEVHRPFTIGLGRLYARQVTRLPVGFVYLTTVASVATVQLTDTVSLDFIHVCLQVLMEDWEVNELATHKFDCGETRAFYVTTALLDADMRVTSSTDGICGVHVNTKSARFFEMRNFTQVENATAEVCSFYIPPDLDIIRPPLFAADNSTFFELLVPGSIFTVYVTNPSPWTVPQLRNDVNGVNLVNCSVTTYEAWETALIGVTKFDCGGVSARYIRLVATLPSGLNVRVLGDDFLLCATQTNDLVDDTSSFMFAKYGSTTGPCLCDPGFVGPTCNIGISAWRLSEDDAQWSYRQCGDSTQPKRGTAGEETCTCESIGDIIVFNGEACECAIVDGNMCAGHGTCETVSFPEGRCSFDKSQLESDQLSTPYSRLVYGTSTYVTSAPSVFYFGGTNWTFIVGDVFILKFGTLAINLCIDISIPVTFEFTDINSPTSGNLTLPGGKYEAIFKCMYATFTETSTQVFSIGTLDCSNPVDRMVDDSSMQYHKIAKQCANTFFHSTGLGYGIFHNLTSGIDFTDSIWTLEHYRLISSVIGNRRCDDFSVKDWDIIVNNFAPTYWVPEGSSTAPQLLPNKRTRVFYITAPFDIDGVIAFSPTNETCAIVANMIPSTGGYVDCRCKDGCNRFELISPTQDINAVTATSWYRNVSYDTVYESLQTSILIDHVIPIPTLETCSGGAQINITNINDQAYLVQFYETKLAMRSCADNVHCQQFVSDATCEYDNVNTKHVPWLNGDELDDVAFGEEGGCECRTDTTGFFAHKTFCSSCVLGYGPDTPFEVRAVYSMIDLVPDFLQDGVTVQRCTLPSDSTSTRPSTICGGRGHVRQTRRSELLPVRAVSSTIKRCQALILKNGDRYDVLDVDAAHTELQSFKNETLGYLHVIHNRVFLTSEEVFDYTCEELGGELEFVIRRIQSSLVALKRRSVFTFWI